MFGAPGPGGVSRLLVAAPVSISPRRSAAVTTHLVCLTGGTVEDFVAPSRFERTWPA